MPERWLREGIRRSRPVGDLSDPAFRLYVLLITFHDDYGRFEADPETLRAELYPRRVDRVREADVSRWMAECQTAGLIVLYGSPSKPLGLVLKTEKPRAKRSRFDAPPDGIDCWRVGPPAYRASCERVQTDARMSLQVRPYTYSDTESDTDAYTASPDAESLTGGILEVAGYDDVTRNALKAFDTWSQADRGFPLRNLHNEHRPVVEFLKDLAQRPPIVRADGAQIPQAQYVPQAAENLSVDKATKFKGVKYAVKCVASLLEEWARDGPPGKRGQAPSLPIRYCPG